MINTKSVNRINRNSYTENYIQAENRKSNLFEQSRKGLKSFDDLFCEIENIWEKNKVFTYNGADVVFYPELLVLLDCNSKQISVGRSFRLDNLPNIVLSDKKFIGELMSETEARTIFFKYSAKDRENNFRQVLCVNDASQYIGCILNDEKFYPIAQIDDTKEKYFINELIKASTLRLLTCHHFDGSNRSKLEILIEIGLVPEELESKKLFLNLLYLVRNGFVAIDYCKIALTKKGKKAIEDGECTRIGNVTFERSNIDKIKKDANIALDLGKIMTDEGKKVLSYYSECDKLRANINSYDLAWLEDPNRGHWELWDGNESDYTIAINNAKIYARNPESDIKRDSIVGIDFGTKSTVVVFQDETGRIKPLPIGNGDIRKELEKRDFENPTVMQFISIGNFLKDYNAKSGRPYTKWKDLIISHAANDSMQDTGIRSDEFYSYLYDLKQWAGEGNKTVNLRDKKGKDIKLPPFEKIVGEEINKDKLMNPIEIYAYYIGLYINNMNNGIYMDYLLSFPVTYEKNVRNAILESFKCGLMKSLAESILSNDEVMDEVKVLAGASEPAAYAICALESFAFEPEDDDKVFYGIFDFGGGTTDFDFGLWKQSKDDELFDYSIEHFGTEGDRYLGGENLLQLITFEVFRQNIALCRKEKIPFSAPIERIDISSELMGFVNDSQEARINQKLMMEKLRPFWERSDDSGEQIIDIDAYSEFQVSLFNVEGTLKSNLAFEVDVEKLDKILEARIEKGVKQFFEALKGTFSSKNISRTAQVDSVNIFLAGNSSKSVILQEIFNKKINEWNKEIIGEKTDDKKFFKLFPPLGTVAAKKIQCERGVDVDNELESPTGKTGVAWGLIEGREGGRIEVIEEVSFESEAKFAFYIGIQKGKYFCPKINRDIEYNEWIKILPARRKINEILYTSLPEAASRKLLCSEIGVFRKRLEIPVIGDDKSIYIRIVSTEIIEYAVGNSEGVIDTETIKCEVF